MLAIWGIGPIGGLVGLIAGIVLVLRKRGGFSLGAIAWRRRSSSPPSSPLPPAGSGGSTKRAPCSTPTAPRRTSPSRCACRRASHRPTAIKAELHTEKNKMPASLVAR